MGETLEIKNLTSAEVWNYENGFYWFSDNRRLGKLIAHYELYKRISGLAGDIVECGVYKAVSLLRFATFRELLEVGHSRRIVAFDAFGKFPRAGIDGEVDQAFIERFENEGGDGLSAESIQDILSFKALSNSVELVPGDVRETVPAYLSANPTRRIALLHLDMDVYEPTKVALERFWDHLVPGAIVVIDDYNAVEGATRAVDEFVAAKGIARIEKLPCCHVPAFFVK